MFNVPVRVHMICSASWILSVFVLATCCEISFWILIRRFCCCCFNF